MRSSRFSSENPFAQELARVYGPGTERRSSRFAGQVPGQPGHNSLEPVTASPRAIADRLYGPSAGTLEHDLAEAAQETGLSLQVIEHLFVNPDGTWREMRYARFLESAREAIATLQAKYAQIGLSIDDIVGAIETDCVNRRGEVLVTTLEAKLGLFTPEYQEQTETVPHHKPVVNRRHTGPSRYNLR